MVTPTGEAAAARAVVAMKDLSPHSAENTNTNVDRINPPDPKGTQILSWMRLTNHESLDAFLRFSLFSSRLGFSIIGTLGTCLVKEMLMEHLERQETEPNEQSNGQDIIQGKLCDTLWQHLIDLMQCPAQSHRNHSHDAQCPKRP